MFQKACKAFAPGGDEISGCYGTAAKTEDERRVIITQAQKDVPGLRKLYKERQAEIQRVRRENLEAERKEKERKEQERKAELERLVEAVETLGGQ